MRIQNEKTELENELRKVKNKKCQLVLDNIQLKKEMDLIKLQNVSKIMINETMTKKAKITCGNCDKMFNDSIDLEKHEDIKHAGEIINVQCRECQQLMFNRNSLISHMETNHNKKSKIKK